MKKKSCCYRLIKYLTIIILLASLIGAGFTVPSNIELIKNNDQDKDSQLKRYIVYGTVGCLASLIGISLVAVSVDGYCLTLLSGIFMTLMTLVVAAATATTIFVFDETLWINIAELGIVFVATIFLLLFTGMVKARKSKKRSSIVVPFTQAGATVSEQLVAKVRPPTPVPKNVMPEPMAKVPSMSEPYENNNPPPILSPPQESPSPPELNAPEEVYEPSRPPSPVPDLSNYDHFLMNDGRSIKPESINEEGEDHEDETKHS